VHHIQKALSGIKSVYVVQIGSHDGKTGDPIRSLLLQNLSWATLFVEPVPFLFERLRQNYADSPRFRFENVAIGQRSGVTTFYYIDEAAKEHVPELPGWFYQLGSFDRDHISRHFGSAVNRLIDRFIVTADVPTLSLAALLERNNVDQIDLLHVDAEGYDWEIVRQLDLTRYNPEVILFEHKHLSIEAKSEARAFLQDRYRIMDFFPDYFCRRAKSTARNRAVSRASN
jgi:FkbM family methyltransferase